MTSGKTIVLRPVFGLKLNILIAFFNINKRILKLFNIFRLLMKWVVKLGVYDLDKRVQLETLETFMNAVERSIRSKGASETIKRLKATRVAFYKLITSGVIVNTPWIAQYKSGCPKMVGHVIDRAFINSHTKVPAIRFILTLLSISRAIPGWKKPSISTIVLPAKIKDKRIMIDFCDFISGYNIPKVTFKPFEELHATTKMGPNGPALQTATKDWIPFNLRYGLSSILMMKAPNLVGYLQGFSNTFVFWPNFSKRSDDQLILRRLSVIDDKEGKSRVIGIADYWSQSVLKPLHDQLMAILSKFPGDRTFKQTDFSPIGESPHRYYSFDLTAATDRFPIKPQYEVIKSLHGESFARTWIDLMVGEPFFWNGKSIYYNCGQPMGAYSSWAAFSLTHHLLVQYAASKVGITNFSAYYLLGDDIVIRHDKVATKYLEIMDALGVEISLPKTLIADNSFEFAKRIFINGTEVSPFPVSGLVNTVNSWTEFIMVLGEARRRNYRPFLTYSALVELWTTFKNEKIKGFVTLNSDWIRRRNIKSMVFYSYLTRFEEPSLMERAIEDFGIPLPATRGSRFWFQVKEYLARGHIQNQTERIFQQVDYSDWLSIQAQTHLKDLTEYQKLMFPVSLVLQEQFARITLAVSGWEQVFDRQDYDNILYEKWVDLGIDPKHVLSIKNRVLAKVIQSRALMKGLQFWKDELNSPYR